MAERIIAILLLLIILKHGNKITKVIKFLFGNKEEQEVKDPQEVLAARKLSHDRACNGMLVQAWINQRNKINPEKIITEWKFSMGSAKKIIIRFSDDEIVDGYLSIHWDKVNPRVTSFNYINEAGDEIVMEGYELPELKKDILVKGYKASRKDERKLIYLNEVSSRSIMHGSAILNLLEYEKINEAQFPDLFGEKEIDAFIESLVSDNIFAKIERGQAAYELIVFPVTPTNAGYDLPDEILE